MCVIQSTALSSLFGFSGFTGFTSQQYDGCACACIERDREGEKEELDDIQGYIGRAVDLPSQWTLLIVWALRIRYPCPD